MSNSTTRVRRRRALTHSGDTGVNVLLEPPVRTRPSTRSSLSAGDATATRSNSYVALNPEECLPTDADLDVLRENELFENMKYYCTIMCQIAFVGVCVCIIVVIFENHVLDRLNETIQTYHHVASSAKAAEQESVGKRESRAFGAVMKCQRMYRSLQSELSTLRTYVKGISDRNAQDDDFLDRLITKKISTAINMYDADKNGLIDYALESNGGTITSLPSTTPFPTSYDVIGLIRLNRDSNSQTMIRPGVMPGQCFAFRGSKGRIRIALARHVYISAVSVEHAPKEILLDWTSAPKEIRVIGLEDENALVGDQLGFLTYAIDGESLQTFAVDESVNKAYRFLELNVLSNYGNRNLTCIYRFRVHGTVSENFRR